MKIPALIIFLFLTVSCGQNENDKYESLNVKTFDYKSFDNENHFRPLIDKSKFDTLHGWDFGWLLLEPVSIARSGEDEMKLLRKFSPGQKSLYFIWYLDAEVTNGGFIQFYWNDYGKYIPAIKDGLRLMGDSLMLDLVSRADSSYMDYQDEFALQKRKGDWEPLYDSLIIFEKYDSIYYLRHDKTMEMIEAYARRNQDDFLKFN